MFILLIVWKGDPKSAALLFPSYSQRKLLDVVQTLRFRSVPKQKEAVLLAIVAVTSYSYQ